MGDSATMFKAVFLLQIIFFPLSISYEQQVLKESSDSSPFPPGFLFGTAASAYQYEGAYMTDGKGLNNWDVFTHKYPGQIKDRNNGDVAVDQYHRYLEDINLMVSLGVNSYRFSISWARILPKGRFGGVNYAGIKYYNSLIDGLLSKGLQPFVTLNHLESPQELEDRYGSWLSSEMQNDFQYLADVCFKYFGDRVKYWATFNEPNRQIILGYRTGEFPPLRCSLPFGNCTQGDSEKEPFVAAHNMILAHMKAVDTYRTKYQKVQGGSIGIVVECPWFEPISNSTADIRAAERAHSFHVNWFLDPIIFGTYPVEMDRILGPLLPMFTRNELDKLNKGLDFIGVNHYTSYYVQDCLFNACEPGEGASRTEGFALKLSQKDGVTIGEPTDIAWLRVYPQGIHKRLNYLKHRYNDIPMFITENGFGELQKPNSTIQEFLHDVRRVDYLAGYLDAVQTAMREGADVRGYFVWSLLDNFEWAEGYTNRFGLHHVDYATLKRTPKLSARWYRDFIAQHKTYQIQEQ